jgi:hypothetical protein
MRALSAPHNCVLSCTVATTSWPKIFTMTFVPATAISDCRIASATDLLRVNHRHPMWVHPRLCHHKEPSTYTVHLRAVLNHHKRGEPLFAAPLLFRKQRRFTKKILGLVEFDEPFHCAFAQGIISRQICPSRAAPFYDPQR